MTPLVRLALASTAGAVAAAALVATSGATASAAEQGGVLVSLDGVSYSAAPEGSIFPADVALVPGTSTTTRFWVRNESGIPARLSLAVAGATATSADFVDALSLQAGTAATPEGVPVPLTAVESCAPLLQGEVLAPGATTEVRVALLMSADGGNAGQSSTADAQLRVSLTDATAPATAPDCSVGGFLPLTPGATDTAAPTVTSTTTTEGHVAGDQPATTAAPDAFALPTLPFGDDAAPPLALAASVAGIVAAAMVLILVRRKRRSDVSS